MSEPWEMFRQALPHTLRVCAAFDEPGHEAGEAAWLDAMRILQEQGDAKLAMMAWARGAGLAGIEGAILLERHLAGAAPKPWAAHAEAMIDAGITGQPERIAAALARAAGALGGNVGNVGQALASFMADWMRAVGGVRAYNIFLKQHVAVYDPAARPAEAAVIEPASLAVAAGAAGEPVLGRSIVDYHCERGPETTLALAHVWLRLLARVSRTTLVLPLLVHAGDEGHPDKAVAEPATDLEKTGALVLDAIALLAGGGSGAARALSRVDSLPPGEWQAMNGVMAYTLGSHYRSLPRN